MQDLYHQQYAHNQNLELEVARSAPKACNRNTDSGTLNP